MSSACAFDLRFDRIEHIGRIHRRGNSDQRKRAPFLHTQVRSIAGSLEHVGSGKWNAADLRAALDARDRRRCGMVAPPEGLYLMGVDYDMG